MSVQCLVLSVRVDRLIISNACRKIKTALLHSISDILVVNFRRKATFLHYYYIDRFSAFNAMFVQGGHLVFGQANADQY